MGGPALLGTPQRRLAGDGPGWPQASGRLRGGDARQLLRGGGLRRLGGQAPAHRGGVGARRRRPGPRRSSTCLEKCGNGPRAPTRPILDLRRHRARWASTTPSSWSGRWCSRAPRGRPRPATAVPRTGTSSIRTSAGCSPACVSPVTRRRRRGPRLSGSTLSPGYLAPAGGCRRNGSTTRRGRSCSSASAELPEYYPTRQETALLASIAPELAACIPAGATLVELGSGASLKTRLLLDAAPQLAAYAPVDISETAVAAAAAAIARDYPSLRVTPVTADFTQRGGKWAGPTSWWRSSPARRSATSLRTRPWS